MATEEEGITVKVHHKDTALVDYIKVPFICEREVAASGTCLMLTTDMNADRSRVFC